MSKITKIQRAISVIEYTLKKRRDLVDSMSRRLDLNENQKIYIGDETSLIKNVEFLLKEYTNVVNQSLGKLPPQAIDLEETVLGGILLESGKGVDIKGNPTTPAIDKISSFLTERHFYNEKHKVIFRSIMRLVADKEPIDMRTVVMKLRTDGAIEEAGGAYYIAELTSKLASAQNIEYCARILVELAIKRELILLAGNVLQEAFSDTSDCFELLESTDSHVKEMQSWIKK